MEQFFKRHPSGIGIAIASFLLGSALFNGLWGLAFAVAGFVVGETIDSRRH